MDARSHVTAWSRCPIHQMDWSGHGKVLNKDNNAPLLNRSWIDTSSKSLGLTTTVLRFCMAILVLTQKKRVILHLSHCVSTSKSCASFWIYLNLIHLVSCISMCHIQQVTLNQVVCQAMLYYLTPKRLSLHIPFTATSNTSIENLCYVAKLALFFQIQP